MAVSRPIIRGPLNTLSSTVAPLSMTTGAWIRDFSSMDPSQRGSIAPNTIRLAFSMSSILPVSIQ